MLGFKGSDYVDVNLTDRRRETREQRQSQREQGQNVGWAREEGVVVMVQGQGLNCKYGQFGVSKYHKHKLSAWEQQLSRNRQKARLQAGH